LQTIKIRSRRHEVQKLAEIQLHEEQKFKGSCPEIIVLDEIRIFRHGARRGREDMADETNKVFPWRKWL